MLSIVNGYVCRSGCDVAVAKKGRDPRNPTGNPIKAEQLAVRDGKPADAARDAQKVSFSGDGSAVAGPSWLKSRPTSSLGALIDRLA